MKRRFYRATLPTIVWDPNENKALAKFVNGTFTTEDEDAAIEYFTPMLRPAQLSKK